MVNGKKQTLTITLDSISTTIQADSTINIKLSSFNNPISASTSGLVIKTFDNLEAQIDESAEIFLSVTTPASIIESSVTIDSGSNRIN